jgi:protoheme IX farnesyltransferase
MDHAPPEPPFDAMMSDLVKNYLLITKPGIVCGNLITAAGGFFLAAGGQIETAVLLPTLIGISMVVACGCIFNNCIDRKLDLKMSRTRNRPLARGLISPKMAVCCATLLGIGGAALIGAAANWLAVGIVLAGLAIYVVVYSLYLKRSSVYGTLIGSLAGAAPPLAGYCAVRGRFDMGALMLLAIFSLWQMPHCYAIAIFRSDDYAAAKIPVLSGGHGMPAVKKHIFLYILAFIAATLLPTFGGYTGFGYLTAAAALCLLWLYLAWTGRKASNDRLWARKLFVFSILSVFILSIMMSIDCRVPADANIILTYMP